MVFPAVPGGGNGSVGLVVLGGAVGAVSGWLGVAAFGVGVFGVSGLAGCGGCAGCADSAHGSPGFFTRPGVSVLAGCGGCADCDGCAHGAALLAVPPALGESRGGAVDGLGVVVVGAVSVCSTGIALGGAALLRSRLRHAPRAVAAMKAERTSQRVIKPPDSRSSKPRARAIFRSWAPRL